MSRAGWRALLVPALIVLGAAALRVWRLDAVPLGLHNDEAWTGIGARAVLHEGWIGPYLYPSGLGQPAGPVYLTALLFLVLPQTTFTLRLSMALLGVAAVARAVTATVVSMLFFAWLLLLAAAIEVAQAVAVGHWAGFFQHLLAAILFGVTGLIMVMRPLVTAEVLTLFMAMFFLIGGLFQLIGAAWVGLPGWGWHVVDGVITLALGLLVLARWPASGLWVIGLFLGIDLIFYGMAWIVIALGLRAA